MEGDDRAVGGQPSLRGGGRPEDSTKGKRRQGAWALYSDPLRGFFLNWEQVETRKGRKSRYFPLKENIEGTLVKASRARI